ncbi:hypothetical protein KP509_08G037100 [Ceratopteris richardii]|uniref:Uncharacterized protein n=1 Tax=Ceratopteris richardii TaxID=49495 RepID=A0A8T2UFK2_CERRI|nr:hypothetical protein KP509_08G037100 [Ceratopteris richardii]
MSCVEYDCMFFGYDFRDGDPSRISSIHSLNTVSHNQKPGNIHSRSSPYAFSYLLADDDRCLKYSPNNNHNTSSRSGVKGSYLHPIYEVEEDPNEEDIHVDRSAPIVRFFKSCLIQFSFLLHL